jgi:hypothetical protein
MNLPENPGYPESSEPNAEYGASSFTMRIGRRWHEQVRCHAIAQVEHLENGINVHLCRRWRWHWGECRAAHIARSGADDD